MIGRIIEQKQIFKIYFNKFLIIKAKYKYGYLYIGLIFLNHYLYYSHLSIIPKYFVSHCCYSEYITSNYNNKLINYKLTNMTIR